MAGEVGASTTILDWAVATRALPGQAVSGDLHLVARRPGGILVAVVDGLGHGAEAARAAETAVALLLRYAHEPISSLVERCHEQVRSTRGVVLSLATLDGRDETLTWLGVGNVAGALQRAETAGAPRLELLTLRGGIVGERLPRVQSATLPIAAGDTLLFATDGCDGSVTQAIAASLPPQRAADYLLARYARANDDALVLVARYRGRGR